jgi:hypothetical protein
MKETKTHNPSFFKVMSWIFLGLVFIGFAPSFYLKFLLEEQPFYPKGLPFPYILHGFVLTIWYVLLVFQATFIENRKLNLHSKMGYFGAFWAFAVLISTFWVISLFPARMAELANDLGKTIEEVEPGLSGILWLDFFMCLLFVGFVGIGISERNNTVVHKRMMFFSGLVFLFAAVFRVGGIIGFLTGIDAGPILGLGMLLMISTSLLFHDKNKFGRVLSLTWICFGTYWLAIIASFILGESDSAKRFILELF